MQRVQFTSNCLLLQYVPRSGRSVDVSVIVHTPLLDVINTWYKPCSNIARVFDSKMTAIGARSRSAVLSMRLCIIQAWSLVLTSLFSAIVDCFKKPHATSGINDAYSSTYPIRPFEERAKPKACCHLPLVSFTIINEVIYSRLEISKGVMDSTAFAYTTFDSLV